MMNSLALGRPCRLATKTSAWSIIISKRFLTLAIVAIDGPALGRSLSMYTQAKHPSVKGHLSFVSSFAKSQRSQTKSSHDSNKLDSFATFCGSISTTKRWMQPREDDEDSGPSVPSRETGSFDISPPLPSSNPFAAQVKGGRSSLYSDEELQNVLAIHQSLALPEDDEVEVMESSSSSSVLSLHDLVQQAIGTESVVNDDKDGGDTIQTSATIRGIACDVDGTLLGRDQTVHPLAVDAITRALELKEASSALTFFPATGKSRRGALDSLGPLGLSLESAGVPGVFLQGLRVVDGDGTTVLYEAKLSAETVRAVEGLCAKHLITDLVAYDGDCLFTTADDSQVCRDIHEVYGEPMPAYLKSLAEYCGGADAGLHKILVMVDPSNQEEVERLNSEFRSLLEDLAASQKFTVTQAIPHMLEVLPPGTSKAVGVRKLCECLGIGLDEMMALGDAENDVDMLRMVSLGVAVGNACPAAKAAADVVMDETVDQGGAGIAIKRYVLQNTMRND